MLKYKEQKQYNKERMMHSAYGLFKSEIRHSIIKCKHKSINKDAERMILKSCQYLPLHIPYFQMWQKIFLVFHKSPE